MLHTRPAGPGATREPIQIGAEVYGHAGVESDLEVQRLRTADLDLPAPRPAWSVLDCSKAEALGVRRRDWREAVRAYLRSEESPLRVETKAR